MAPRSYAIDAQHTGAQDKETKDTPLSKGLDKALLACAPLAMVAYGLGAAVFHTKACVTLYCTLLLQVLDGSSLLLTCMFAHLPCVAHECAGCKPRWRCTES